MSFLPFPDSRLKLSQAQGNLSVLETQQVQLECVVLNRTSAASQLVVEWFVWKPNHPERETVARLSREATFHYGEQAAKNNLKGRLHLESPSSGVYRLFIQNVAVQDSGTYSCHVEEWLPSPSGVWYKRAEDTAGQMAVTVMRPGEASHPQALTALGVSPRECPTLCAAQNTLFAVKHRSIYILRLQLSQIFFPLSKWEIAHLALA